MPERPDGDGRHGSGRPPRLPHRPRRRRATPEFRPSPAPPNRRNRATARLVGGWTERLAPPTLSAPPRSPSQEYGRAARESGHSPPAPSSQSTPPARPRPQAARSRSPVLRSLAAAPPWPVPLWRNAPPHDVHSRRALLAHLWPEPMSNVQPELSCGSVWRWSCAVLSYDGLWPAVRLWPLRSHPCSAASRAHCRWSARAPGTQLLLFRLPFSRRATRRRRERKTSKPSG